MDNTNANTNNADNTTDTTPTPSAWEEHQRRQRSIRTVMMFLMMLILMDGDESQNNINESGQGSAAAGSYNRRNRSYLRKGQPTKPMKRMDFKLWNARRGLDHALESAIQSHSHSQLQSHSHTDSNEFDSGGVKSSTNSSTGGTGSSSGKGYFHERFQKILDLNNGQNEAHKAESWALATYNEHMKALDVTDDVNSKSQMKNKNKSELNNIDSNSNSKEDELKHAEELLDNVMEGDRIVWTYPRNATGSYRGEWDRIHDESQAYIPRIGLQWPNNNDDEEHGGDNKHDDPSLDHGRNSSDGANGDMNANVNANASANIGTDAVALQNYTILTRQQVASMIPRLHGSETSKGGHKQEQKQKQGQGDIQSQSSYVGLHLLPPRTILGNETKVQFNNTNVTSIDANVDGDGNNKNEKGEGNHHRQNQSEQSASGPFLSELSTAIEDPEIYIRKPKHNHNGKNDPLYFTKESGSTVLRLYTRRIPGITQISLLDGIVYLNDVNDLGFTNQNKHLILRVKGVVFHGLGRISLVANAVWGRSVLVVNGGNENAGEDQKEEVDMDIDIDTVTASGRKLMQMQMQLENEMDLTKIEGRGVDGDMHVGRIRDEALQNFGHLYAEGVGGENWRRHLQSVEHDSEGNENENENIKEQIEEDVDANHSNIYVGGSPFVPDDSKGSLYKTPPKVLKATPPLATIHGKDCEFELEFNITETQWTVGEWRQMALSQLARKMHADPTKPLKSEQNKIDENEWIERHRYHTRTRDERKKGERIREEAVVMNMLGTIRSPQCNFISNVNVTAVRTDWERTSTKAINYCFLMMMACLAQTVFILKQLIYSQSQAANVSLLSVGWHTVVDAIFCVEHILLCMLLEPVSTAFAMVAFLKLLIFCVIEMKYMVMVMKAGYTAAGNELSTVEFKQKVNILHICFYTALIGAIVLLWNCKESHRTLGAFVMYGFWVPQIIKNIRTEAKKPLHKKFIYGMSATRLVAPIYTLAIPRNFFTEIEPNFPVDYFTCQIIVLWIGFQVALLIGQSKYGARFMIPARFQPPKYDYSRPIPAHMRPTISQIKPQKSTEADVESDALLENDVICSDVGPRNRKEKRSRNGSGDSNGITTINHTETYKRPTLDCVICYNDIDIGDRMEYMIAPCNHIFHRECLTQWMDVKMECPVCRTNLPAL